MLSDPLCACTMHSGYSSLYSVARQWILDKKISSYENGILVSGGGAMDSEGNRLQNSMRGLSDWQYN